MKSSLEPFAIGGNKGGIYRYTWWCGYCREDFDEPRGAHYYAPVVYGIDSRYGVQSRRCHCGRKLRRLTS